MVFRVFGSSLVIAIASTVVAMYVPDLPIHFVAGGLVGRSAHLVFARKEEAVA